MARKSVNASPKDASRANVFSSLLEHIPEGAFVGSAPAAPHEGITTLAANRHLRHIFGYAAGAPDADVLPFSRERFGDSAAHTTFFDRLVRDGVVTSSLVRMRRVDEAPLWVEVTARVEAAPDGAFRIDALLRDVSERKRIDDQSRDRYHQLLQTEKMAALGQTISGVAHELNNPLATILSWAERLAERPLDDISKRGAEVILGEAERAARIVRHLLTFARKRRSTRAMVDVNQVIRETLALRAEEHRLRNITVIDATATGLPPVFADSHQVQQVLLNLVINAEQAMLTAHGRGSLVVRSWHDIGREVVVMEVNDDGPGVSGDVRSKIFDPFFTTKEVGKGTGLGLTVAYAIVQEHGGRIDVASSAGQGASFYVELPVGGVQHAQRQRAPGAPAMEAARGARVLVVEDELALAAAVTEALSDAGLSVTHAADGEDALVHLNQDRYDLVICDLRMPRVDGMTLFRSMKAGAVMTPVPEVIFVTGDVAGTDAERFLEESGCRWLAKPFRLGDLLRTVRETLA